MKIIHEATKVKKAFLIEGEDYYELQHWDTIILKVNKFDQVLHAYKCSPSSTRAIHQVCDYLGLDFSEVKKQMVTFTDFHKYSFGS